MRTLSITTRTFPEDLAAFCRGSLVSRELSAGVAAILTAVHERGDEAVGYYAAKFDGAKLQARDFRVKPAELTAAARRLRFHRWPGRSQPVQYPADGLGHAQYPAGFGSPAQGGVRRHRRLGQAGPDILRP